MSAESESSGRDRDWTIRPAVQEDAEAVAAGVQQLLVELGGSATTVAAMAPVVTALIEDPAAGAIFVAEARGKLMGVIAASWQMAIHVPGSYGLIQDLWVDPSWRSRSVGAELIEALVELARSRGMPRLEVGLPRERFAGFAATEAFYLRNGFQPLGPRMRRVLR